MNHETDEFIEKYFDLLNYGNQIKLESMKSSEFVFDHLLYYKCHKIILNCGGSNIGSPHSLKNKKTTVNPINKKYMKS